MIKSNRTTTLWGSSHLSCGSGKQSRRIAKVTGSSDSPKDCKIREARNQPTSGANAQPKEPKIRSVVPV